jgi:hypothetical protein
MGSRLYAEAHSLRKPACLRERVPKLPSGRQPEPKTDIVEFDVISHFVEDDALTANELLALQAKWPLHTFRCQGKPITVLHSQKQVSRLEPLNLGKSRLGETRAGSNDCTIFARVADPFENEFQHRIARRIRPGT